MHTEFALHLPYLRRFARALTGNQATGDTLVKQSLLELRKLDVAETKLDHKLVLYREFLNAWKTSDIDNTQATDEATQRISHLSNLNRSAFLLDALEEMSKDDIASVMQIERSEVAKLIGAAESEIQQGLRTNVLIIEDEPMIAADLASILTNLGHEVSGIAPTHTDALELVKEETPGLILADVHLADDSSGIEAVDEILGDFSVPVIFITAFPEMLLTGERAEPAYLISKPFSVSNVKAAISQALYFFDA